MSFFERYDHKRIASDSLIPSGDPTVLFTSAGMNQFKDAFLGKRTDLTRAASCQQCLRTGDLEKVGKTASHHTFFEMLGNFSFGDYFKREAIQWAWEFLTAKRRDGGVELPANKLWVTVFEADDEAFGIWEKIVPARRIVRLGEADNFWPANARTQGPNGPCGPCSEVHFDRTGKCLKGHAKCAPGCDCGRFVEVWNLVFTQFDRQEGGTLAPLPRKHIDTGMGLERLASVVQGTETDYETDLFAPIMDAIRKLPRGKKVKKDRVTFAERVIADHARAIVFLLAEGITPSNESRGYVLRMLIRRAHRLGRTDLNLYTSTTRTFLTSLVESVEEAMRGSPYSATLEKQRDVIRRVIRHEEMQFVMTLEAGTTRLEEVIASARGKTIAGDEAFKLYDTYGFPVELTIDIAQERGFTVDRQTFERALKSQQERSRAASQFGDAVFVPTTLKLEGVAKSDFIGYQALEADARVKGIWKQDQWVQSASQGEEIGVVLDRSPFYGEAGGQVGDQGTIECPKGLLDVVDAKWADDLLVHHAKVQTGSVAVNEPARAKVSVERRTKIARSHTATHLLHWALRKVLGPETVQAGSLVEAERVRFDFSALGGLHEDQWMKVEQLVNERIRAADEVTTQLMKLEEAKQAGALALFGEKYGRQVRVVSISDYSRELCGGTHLKATGSIGTFRLVAESSIAAGTRRVEAVVGEAALARQQQESQVLRDIARQLSRSPSEALQGLEELLQQLKASEKRLKTMQAELAHVRATQLVADAKRLDGVTLVVAQIDGVDREFLAAVADAIRGSVTDGIALLVSKEQSTSVAWVMALTATLVKRGLHAGELLKAIAALTNGGGGGRPEFAQAGGKDPSRIPEALRRAEQLIREALERRG